LYASTGRDGPCGWRLLGDLPHVGDTVEPQTSWQGIPLSAITGDGRTPPSAFSGTISLASAVDSNGFPIEHTVDAVATIDRNPATNSNTWLAGTAPAATGLRMIIPNLTPSMTGTMTITYDTLGNVNDDIYTSNFGSQALGNGIAGPGLLAVAGASNALAAGGSGAIYVGNRSNDVSAMVLEVMLGSTLWFDDDGDGVQGAGESGIPAMAVELYSPGPDGVIGGIDDVLVMTTTTDANGDYLFDELHPDNYYVVVPTAPITAPMSSGPTGLLDDGIDGDDNGAQAGGPSTATYSPVISLTVGTEPTETFQGGTPDDQDDDSGDLTIDFGFTPLGSIGDTIWHDLNGDGVMDANEVGIPNVEVWLTPAAGADLGNGPGVPITVTTSSTGTYLFDGLPMGAYTVTVDTSTLPNDKLVTATGDPDGGGDSTSTTNLTSDAPDDLDQDFGYEPFGSVGDTIWHDLNGDGVQDVGELGIGGVDVSLTPPAGVDLGNGPGVAITTTTDSSGMYLFSELPLGETYVVTVDTSDLPNDKLLSPTADPDGGDDSTSSVTLLLDDPETEEDEANNLDQDFAYQPFGSVGDTIWHDLNGDGVQDAGELGIGGVEVSLTPPAGVDLGNGPGVAITTTTDSTGMYFFPDLPLGETYVVTVDTSTLPGDKLTSATGDPDGGADSTSQVTLTNDDPATEEDEANNLDQDFGYEPFGSIGDTIWHDTNGDGVQDAGELGIGGIDVSLTPPAGVDLGNGPGVAITTTTDGSGMYLFPDLPLDDYTS